MEELSFESNAVLHRIQLCICMYACMYVCMYVYLYESIYLSIYLCRLLLSNEVHRSHKYMDLISGMDLSGVRHETTD